ncbi:unnamed protein product, partial [Effrenium voratum]
DLAELLRSCGKGAEAKEMLREVVKGRQEQLGQRNVECLRATRSLAQLLRRQGELPEAEMLLRRVLEGYECLEPPMPEEVEVAEELADLLQRRGKLAAAE